MREDTSQTRNIKRGHFAPPLQKSTEQRPRLLRAGAMMVRGSMIIEMTVALALLTTVGLVVLKSSLDVMAPRQWVILQNISDSYMSYEQAYAERVSFDEFTSDSSDW
ncbi:MAG: hypothetical protein ACPGUY_09840, partial [Akkermansiaceae bacterium]